MYVQIIDAGEMCGHVPEAEREDEKNAMSGHGIEKGMVHVVSRRTLLFCKFFFLYLLRGVELGQPEKRNDAVPRFSRYGKEPILPVIMEEGSWFTERA